jgi:acyl-CoA thioesterase-1
MLKKLFLLLGLMLAGPLYAEAPVILIVGDSLSAGYGMDLDQAWPRLLQKRLEDAGHTYRVFNSSITGDTTQGALARLPGLLDRLQPRIIILELGGNDGLRGIGVEVTRANFTRMIEQGQAFDAAVMLTGIRLPPNYGQSYTERFHAMYGELADRYGLLLVGGRGAGARADAGRRHPPQRRRPAAVAGARLEGAGTGPRGFRVARLDATA